MTFALRYAARSDRGLIRGNNEDSVYAGPRLLAIADGMGGHAGGEVASKVAIAAIAHLDEDTPREDLLHALREAIESANVHLREVVAQDPSLDGMGTTLTALLFADRRVGVVHIGDSRCYLLRGDELTQITHDDTFVQALVDEGRLTQEEAGSHPQRSLLLHALNGGDLDPDLSVRETRVGDRYLLCSDGLSDVLSTETLYDALQVAEPRDCADRLVDLTLRGGGPDNVTVIVADVIDMEYGDDIPVVDGAAGINNGRREVAPTSAAARAAIAAPTNTPDDRPTDPEPAPRKRRRGLRLGLGIVLLLILGGVLYSGWRWTQTQYFVRADGDHVAVFRGVNTSLGPWHLYSLERASDLRLDDLQPVAREKVSSGIGADSRTDADQIIDRLRGQLLPECPPATGTNPTPNTSQPTPTPRQTPRPADSSIAPPTPTVPPEPGRDCRVVS